MLRERDSRGEGLVFCSKGIKVRDIRHGMAPKQGQENIWDIYAQK